MFCASVYYLTEVSGRSDSGEGGRRQSFLSSLSAGNTVGKREFDSGLGELHAVGTLQVLSGNSRCSDDLDGSRARSVTSSHFIVQLRDSSGKGNISELTVHIVGTRSGVVTKPDTVVLNDSGVLLNDFNTVQDFTGGLLHLSKLVHVIPELGLCDNSVRGKDDHSVSLWVRDIVRGSLSAHHLELAHDSGNSHLVVYCGENKE